MINDNDNSDDNDYCDDNQYNNSNNSNHKIIIITPVIKAVNDFVSDHDANAAEVHRPRKLRVVEDGLQDAGGEN